MATITESTKVDLKLVIGILLAGISWGVVVANQASQEKRMERVETKIDRLYEFLAQEVGEKTVSIK